LPEGVNTLIPRLRNSSLVVDDRTIPSGPFALIGRVAEELGGAFVGFDV
jgi:hypothetical protein